MAILAMASEPEDYDLTDFTSYPSVTTTASLKRSDTRLAIQGFPAGTQGAGYLACTLPSGKTSIWIRYVAYFFNVTSSLKRFLVLMQGTTPILGVRYSGTTNQLQIDKFDGSVWSKVIGDPGQNMNGNFNIIDLYVSLGNPGTVKLYINNAKIAASANLDLSVSGITEINRIQLEGSQTSSSSIYASELIVADECTLGSRIVVRGPSADGSDTTWTGGYTNIDDTAPDTLFSLGSANGDRRSYVFTDFPALGTGESIGAVKMSLNVVRDTGGPQHVSNYYKLSGTNYDQTSHQPDVIYGPGMNDMLLTDPSTSATWTVTNLNASEIGFKAVT